MDCIPTTIEMYVKFHSLVHEIPIIVKFHRNVRFNDTRLSSEMHRSKHSILNKHK